MGPARSKSSIIVNVPATFLLPHMAVVAPSSILSVSPPPRLVRWRQQTVGALEFPFRAAFTPLGLGPLLACLAEVQSCSPDHLAFCLQGPWGPWCETPATSEAALVSFVHLSDDGDHSLKSKESVLLGFYFFTLFKRCIYLKDRVTKERRARATGIFHPLAAIAGSGSESD